MNSTQVTDFIEDVVGEGVCFDSENIALEGIYCDELSAHRAKKVWCEVLETSFLLDNGHDFKMLKLPNLENSKFVLKCTFHTACGRYAFWRLINHQTPEAQYVIETAHIPACDSRQCDFISAPDLSPKTGLESQSYDFSDESNIPESPNRDILTWLRETVLRKFK